MKPKRPAADKWPLNRTGAPFDSKLTVPFGKSATNQNFLQAANLYLPLGIILQCNDGLVFII